MRARSLLIASLAYLVGCASLLGIDDGVPRGDAGVDAAMPVDAGTDGDAASSVDAGNDVVVVPTCNPTAPFTKISALAELNGSANEEHPRLTADERTIVFQREPGVYVVFRATRPDRFSAFGTPASIGELEAWGEAADPTLDGAGLRIVIASAKTGGQGSYDLWIALRPTVGDPFGLPTVLSTLSSPSMDHLPNFAGGGAVLYFGSDRAGGVGDEDIYRAASLGGASFGAPVLVAGLSTPFFETAPVVSDDERLAFVEHDVSDDAGANVGICMSFRAKASDPWPTPQPVPELRGGDADPAWISPDLCRLYFSSNRAGTWDVYVAERSP